MNTSSNDVVGYIIPHAPIIQAKTSAISSATASSGFSCFM